MRARRRALRRRRVAGSGWVLLALCAAAPVGCEAPPAAKGADAQRVVLEFGGLTMGTSYSVKCWSADPPLLADCDQVQAEADLVLAEVNRQMSTYDPESELSRFNRAGPGEWFPVSAATAEVVAAAIEIHDRTDGALDVTIAPVLRLWRFGAGTDDSIGDAQAPAVADLKRVRRVVGVDKIEVRREPPGLRKSIPGVEIDLSSIAKGYGVDAVAGRLGELGFEHVMVEIGGEVRAAGERPSGGPWRIGVESPEVDRRALAETVPMYDVAMATSGDYRNYRQADGKQVAHIIDPRTGEALLYRGISVTVLAPTCMEADGLATALVVLGDASAYDWCEEHDVAALFQTRREEGPPLRRATAAYERLLGCAVQAANRESADINP
ncbi:MAG: FAD:protein FMN transferase [Pirellulales bacterium]|nr:FAD:protein FMN transferase [Pirellulales bacterium]